MSVNYEVIVSAVGDLVPGKIHTKKYESPDEAVTMAKKHAMPGVLVVIRPSFNEIDGNGKTYFREWKSINGKTFRSVSWPGFYSADKNFPSANRIEELLTEL